MTKALTHLITIPLLLGAQLTTSAQPLHLQVDASAFFQNNEYFGQHADGYTLPGFYLRPHATWEVNPSVTLAAGVHLLHFWGAHRYPAGITYGVWPDQNDSLTANAHVLPWFRAEVGFDEHTTLTVGNLHDEGCHSLPLPLFNPERLYAADPEAGVQLQLAYDHLACDLWVDWREYIWHHSSRQERFTFGLSARGKLHLSDHWTASLPLHFIAQHVGGQALIERRRVQNHFNGATGVALDHQASRWAAGAECLVLGYSQSNSPTVPFSRGWAVYSSLHISFDNAAHADLGLWDGHNFMPLMGSALFGNLSAVDGTTVFDRCRLVTVGVRYEWHQFAHCLLSLEGRYYRYFEQTKASQYSFGLRIDLHPSIPLVR